MLILLIISYLYFCHVLNAAAQKMGITPTELTNQLWDKYNPSQIWVVVLIIGLVAVVALFLYDKFVMKGKRQ